MDKSIIQNIQENDYFSFLLKTALNADIAEKNLHADIKYYGNEIEHLQSNGNINHANLNSRANNVAAMEGLFKEISDDIFGYSQIANEMNIEYSKTFLNNAIQIVTYPETEKVTNGRIRKLPVLSALVGLFIGVFFAFFLEYIKKYRARVEIDRELTIRRDDRMYEADMLKN